MIQILWILVNKYPYFKFVYLLIKLHETIRVVARSTQISWWERVRTDSAIFHEYGTTQ